MVTLILCHVSAAVAAEQALPEAVALHILHYREYDKLLHPPGKASFWIFLSTGFRYI